jgi:hypothetical protein
MTTTEKKEYPNAWVPRTDGETLTGELVEITRAYSDQRAKNGDGFYPLLHIKQPNGNVTTFHAFQVVSYNQVRDKQPLPGETLTITYQGEGTAKNGNNAPKLFRIDIEGRDPETAARNTYAQLFGAADVITPPSPAERAASSTAPTDFGDIPF